MFREHYRIDGSPKSGFEYIDEARQASATHFQNGEVVMSYRCSVCGLWHVGHEPRMGRRSGVKARAERASYERKHG